MPKYRFVKKGTTNKKPTGKKFRFVKKKAKTPPGNRRYMTA